ncbi:heptaprenyl diphosphate synthase component 1 [Siminovitchia fortis]|uniref:heptaprenyl diphosphate synthase component 1 n=2 Tax=Siminovitchia fortis TaxID=254758 RepID=UPI0011A16EB3|nr:heptaprenyl diphosphate synthase component 1 [Siminovitchia fortis]
MQKYSRHSAKWTAKKAIEIIAHGTGRLRFTYVIMNKLMLELECKEMGITEMALCLYEQKTDSIRKMIESKMYHHFLFDHIESPQIDEDRILMLLMAMEDTRIPAEKYEHQITSAMLVQIALDIHDKVAGQQKTLTERQLSVLAGDYFSGLYYHTLAEIGDTDLIRTLAHAIKLINEYKISVYRMEASDLDEFMEDFKKIGTTVIEKFCRHFQTTRHIHLFKELLNLKKLLAEMENFNRGRHSILFEGLKHFCLPQKKSIPLFNLSQRDRHCLKEICSRFIDQSKKVLMEESLRASGLPGVLSGRIKDLTSNYRHLAT